MSKSFFHIFTHNEFVLIQVRSDCKDVFLDWMYALSGRVPRDFVRS